MSENWAADARVGVPMFQVIAKQVSQHKHRPRTVRQIIDQQWLDEESKQQLREIFQVTDADLVRQEHEAAEEARRRTRERYAPVPAARASATPSLSWTRRGASNAETAAPNGPRPRCARSSTPSGWTKRRSSNCAKASV